MNKLYLDRVAVSEYGFMWCFTCRISRVEFSQLPEGMMISNLTDAVGSMSVKEISVSWTPSSDQKDATFFLCFMAFDNIESVHILET